MMQFAYRQDDDDDSTLGDLSTDELSEEENADDEADDYGDGDSDV